MRFLGFFRKIYVNKEKVLIPAVGITVNNILVGYLYDYIFYPYMIWKFGLLKGVLIMMPLSTFVCYLLLLFYDWSKRDWLGLETIKKIKEHENKTTIGKITSWILRKSDLFALIFLSIQFDPFITTVYLRKGDHQYNGMTRRDWKIFFGSAAIANIYWTIIIFTGVSIVEYLWRILVV